MHYRARHLGDTFHPRTMTWLREGAQGGAARKLQGEGGWEVEEVDMGPGRSRKLRALWGGKKAPPPPPPPSPRKAALKGASGGAGTPMYMIVGFEVGTLAARLALHGSCRREARRLCRSRR